MGTSRTRAGWLRRLASGWPGSSAVWLWVVGCYGLLASPLFRVEAITVDSVPVGTAPTSPSVAQEVAARLAPLRGQHLLAVDTLAVAGSVRRLPHVAEASVLRRLPSTLVVRVRQRHPVAHFPYAATFFEVDRQGWVLGPARGQPGSLPVISGALAPGEAVVAGQVGPPPLVAAALAADAAAGVLGSERLSQVHVEADVGRMVLFLGDGSRLVWAEGAGAQWVQPGFHRDRARVLEALRERWEAAGSFTLDLSDPSRVVWRSGELAQ